MWTRTFWKDLTERVIASAAGGALAAVLIGVGWEKVLAASGIAAAVSLLKGLVAAQKGDPTSASLVE